MGHPPLSADTAHTLAGGLVQRLYGPPGTGKTTTLTKLVRGLIREHGPDSTVVCSYTVTAARNIGSRDLGLPDKQVGTLHSLAYRAIGCPDVALDPKILKDWNDRVGPDWRITPDGRRGSPDLAAESGGGPAAENAAATGDELIAAYDAARARLAPPSAMSAELRRFAEAWEGWKFDVDACDFSDMISEALRRARDGEAAPGWPEVLIADEAQDMTPAETALLLAWGKHAGTTVLALDDDQSIMGWRGGDPEPILTIGTGGQARRDDLRVTDKVLGRSYRIPAAVHAVAARWIEHVAHRRDKPYDPRAERGRCYAVSATIADQSTADAIAKDVDAGRSVMVLAACEYQLRPLLVNLRRMGLPFGNGYRPAEPRWNPLGNGAGVSVAERVFRYLLPDERLLAERSRLWTGDDVRAWFELIDAKRAGLAKGAKTAVKLLPSGELSLAQVEGLFADEDALEWATEPDIEWLCSVLLGSKAAKVDYPAAVARRVGPAALVDEPPVTVGTIHSAKGGEADVVYLSPAISGAGFAAWQRGGRSREEIYRQFYVGLTRARQTCVVLGSAERSVPRSLLCPPELMVR